MSNAVLYNRAVDDSPIVINSSAISIMLTKMNATDLTLTNIEVERLDESLDGNETAPVGKFEFTNATEFQDRVQEAVMSSGSQDGAVNIQVQGCHFSTFVGFPTF